jgi:predicted nucleotide-binding protein
MMTTPPLNMNESRFSGLIDSGQDMYSRIFPRRFSSATYIRDEEAVHLLELKAWAAECRAVVALEFGEQSAELVRWQQVGWDSPPDAGRMGIIYDSNSAAAMRLLQDSIALLLEFRVYTGRKRPNVTPTTAPPSGNLHTRRVFIIHGHDLTNTLRLKELLRDRFSLEPVMLSDQPSQGRTIIEKFENEAAACSFAFALLTPDDQVQTATGEHTQARPNVVFELGWFYAKLGRERVIILSRKGTSIHSDLAGMEMYEFTEDVREQMFRIQDELTRAGLVASNSK